MYFLLQSEREGKFVDVAVKKLKLHATSTDKKDFKREIDNLVNISHEFIVWSVAFGAFLFDFDAFPAWSATYSAVSRG